MARATLNLGFETIGRSRAGLVYSHFTMQVDGGTFPAPAWVDFAVVLLGWWCRALLRVLEGELGPIEILFMEGPYSAELGPIQSDVVGLTLVEKGIERRVFYSADVELGPLTQSVSAAASRILEECKKRDWESRDSEDLAQAVMDLRRALASKVH